MPNVTYKPYMLSVFMLSVVMLSVIMLSVVAPQDEGKKFFDYSHQRAAL